MSPPADYTLSSQKVTVPHIPELYDPKFLDLLLPNAVVLPASVATPVFNNVPTNPLMEALKSTTNQTLTANGAHTLQSTLDPVLDAFRSLTGYAEKQVLDELLDKSWKEDANLTLRIIWQLRSIHDGKGEKEAFYLAYSWLYENHPRTAIGNIHLLYEPVCAGRKKDVDAGRPHGYWKDLLNILALATTGELGVTKPKFLHCFTQSKDSNSASSCHSSKRAKRIVDDTPSRPRVKESTKDHNIRQETQAKAAKLEIAQQRYDTLEIRLKDPKYRALYIAVARLFTTQLITDISTLVCSQYIEDDKERRTVLRQLSVASKWAPTAGGSHDRYTNISTAICSLLYHSRDQIPLAFPSMLQSPDTSPRDKELTLRSWYKRWVTTPLRKAIDIPEPLMSSNQWTKIKYNRVASVCMQKNTEKFCKHDPDGFQKYLIDVESGKTTISGATLMPHEILCKIVSATSRSHVEYPQLDDEFCRTVADTKLRVAESQWLTLLGNLKDAGQIENAIAVCDVSGSMGSLTSDAKSPIMPALALSLILAKIAQPPFRDGFITFSEHPEFVLLDPNESLYRTVHKMVQTSWGYNTNFRSVFLDLILPLAIKNAVKQEDMVKRLFVFSDMQFDAARNGNVDWTTTYDEIELAYKQAGYQVPQMVFWDLAAFGTTEVTAERKGVAMMNGFSPALLKVFMGEEEATEEEYDKLEEEVGPANEDQFNPINILKKSVMKASFNGLVVMD